MDLCANRSDCEILHIRGHAFFRQGVSTLLSIPNPGPDAEENNQNILNAQETRALFETPEKYGLEGVTLDSRNRLFVNGELKTRSFQTFYDYWSSYHRNAELSLTSLATNSKDILSYRPNYIGTDAVGNSYWQNYSAVAVYTTDGYVVDFFWPTHTRLAKTAYAIHPSGDVYFLGYDQKEVTLYRIENVWDAEGRRAWYA